MMRFGLKENHFKRSCYPVLTRIFKSGQFRTTAIARVCRISEAAVYEALLDLGLNTTWIDGVRRASESSFLHACDKMSINVGVPFDVATVIWIRVLAERGVNASEIAASPELRISNVKAIESALRVVLPFQTGRLEGRNRGHRLSVRAKLAMAQFFRKIGHLSSLSKTASFFGITTSNALQFVKRLGVDPKIWRPSRASNASPSPVAFPGMTVSQVIHARMLQATFGWGVDTIAKNCFQGDQKLTEKALLWRLPFLGAVHRGGKYRRFERLAEQPAEARDLYLRDFPAGAPIKVISRFFRVGPGTVRNRIRTAGQDPQQWTRDCREILSQKRVQWRPEPKNTLGTPFSKDVSRGAAKVTTVPPFG